MKIRPRTRKDRNGWLTMPMVKNVPTPRKDWIRTNCPDCGQECWMRNDDKETIQIMNLEGAVCTECALRK